MVSFSDQNYNECNSVAFLRGLMLGAQEGYLRAIFLYIYFRRGFSFTSIVAVFPLRINFLVVLRLFFNWYFDLFRTRINLFSNRRLTGDFYGRRLIGCFCKIIIYGPLIRSKGSLLLCLFTGLRSNVVDL